MNSLLYYYNNVQKMAAYRQAKRMQRGALTTQGGFSTTDPALRQTPFTIQCVIRPTKVTSTLQVAFNTKGDSANPRVDLNQSGNIVIYGGGFMLYTKPANLDSIYDIVFVATDSQLSLFVDGTLITSVSYVNTISLYSIGFYFANNSLYFQGDYLLHRHFNYAMSADEVKALDNNGDPAGYVVPLADKYRWEASESNIGNIRFYPNNEGTGVTSYLEDNANGFTGRYAHIILGSSGLLSVYSYQFMGHPVGCVVEAKFKYRSNAPVRVLADNSSLPINMEDAADATIVYRTTGTIISGFSVTVPNADANSWVEIQPVSLRTLGCIAEYLPQNLVLSRKGPAVEPKAKIYEFNIGDEYYKSVLTQAKYPYDCIYRVDYVVDEWDYQPKPIGLVGFLGLTGATILTPDGQDWSTLEKAKVGESRTLLVKMPGSGTPALYIYGGNDYETATARHLKVTIKGITPVSVPISWLDSAKQLPLSDEYMEPLFQSIGGYDMAANGAPEILYNE